MALGVNVVCANFAHTTPHARNCGQKVLYITLSTRKGGIDRSFPHRDGLFFCPKESKMAKNEEKGEIVLYQPEGEVRLEVRVENETVWLTQAQMAELFDKVPQNITIHIKNIYKEGELDKASTCKEYLQVAHEGSREVTRSLKFYNLDVIISVGYQVN